MDPSETLVIPKTEVDSNTEVIPKTELDTDTDDSYRNIGEMYLNNTESFLIQPKLEFPSQDEMFPSQDEIDHTLTPKLEPDLEVPTPVEPLSEVKSEPNPESEEVPLETPSLVEPFSVTQDEESNTSYATSEESEDLPNLSADGEETSVIDSEAPVPEAIQSTSATLITDAALSPGVTIAHEQPSASAAEASTAELIEEVVDVESGWPPQVVDLTEEEGPVDVDIVEVLEVEQNVIYDGSVSRREERRARRKRKRERREQRASNSNTHVSHNNETIEINDELDIEDIDDMELDIENVGASTSRLHGANYGYDSPVTVDIEAFTIPDSPPDSTPQDRLTPPPLRQAQLNNDIPFMNNPAQNHNIIDFQDPNLLFGNLLASPVLEHVDDGIPFLRPNSPDVFPMAHVGEHHPEQMMRPLSPELFPMIPMERPPRPVRRTRMATRNAAAAAAADRSRSRSPLGDDDGGAAAIVDFADAAAAATAANFAEFERLLNPPAAGPPRMLMGLSDFPHSSNMDIQHMQRPSQGHIPDLQHLHMHRPSQSQPYSLQHQPASTSAPVPPPRQPSPPPRAGSLSCPICLDTLGSIQAQRRNLVSTVCGHIFCSHCLEESLKARKECPTCRKKLTKKQYHPIYI